MTRTKRGRPPFWPFRQTGDNEAVYANVVPDDSTGVWGVVYLCDSSALCEMDKREGVAAGHDRRAAVQVETDSGETVPAVAGIACEDHVCEPSRATADYLRRVISGARHHGLPKDYLDYIEPLAK